MATRKLKYVALDEVLRADVNPKDHAGDVIDASISRFGYVEPQIMDDRTGKLIAGHGRLESLLAMRAAGVDAPEGIVVKAGVWTVPVIFGYWSNSDDEAHALGIALNRGPELGGWKRDTLFDLLSRFAEQPSGLDGLGFTPANLDDLRLLAAPPMDLDQLSKRVGQPGDRDFWPVIRVTVAPEVHARWEAMFATLDGDDDNERTINLLDRITGRVIEK